MKGRGFDLSRPSKAPKLAKIFQGGSQVIQRFYKLGPVLDQGNTAFCGGYAAEGIMNSEPIIQSIGGTKIYYRCKEFDGLVGEGTTMDGVIGALKSFRVISEGYITENPQEIYQYVGNVSPVLVALNWTEKMMKPDERGYVKAGGDLIGGHCFLCWGISRESEKIFFRNSWGADFGLSGNFIMKFKEFEKAFAGNGIAAAVKEIRK